MHVALRRLELCAYAVQEIHEEIEQPDDPESKADILLATEKLVSETLDLYGTVRRYVWGEADEQEFFFSKKDKEETEED